MLAKSESSYEKKKHNKVWNSSILIKLLKKESGWQHFIWGQPKSAPSSPYKNRTIQEVDEAMPNTQRFLIQISRLSKVGKDTFHTRN